MISELTQIKIIFFNHVLQNYIFIDYYYCDGIILKYYFRSSGDNKKYFQPRQYQRVERFSLLRFCFVLPYNSGPKMTCPIVDT